MEVLNPSEVVGDGTESLVGGDLLEVRLGQEHLVLSVPIIGAPENFPIVLGH